MPRRYLFPAYLLPVRLNAELKAFCAITGENADDFVADAVAIMLDEADAFDAEEFDEDEWRPS